MSLILYSILYSLSSFSTSKVPFSNLILINLTFVSKLLNIEPPLTLETSKV